MSNEAVPMTIWPRSIAPAIPADIAVLRAGIREDPLRSAISECLSRASVSAIAEDGIDRVAHFL